GPQRPAQLGDGDAARRRTASRALRRACAEPTLRPAGSTRARAAGLGELPQCDAGLAALAVGFHDSDGRRRRRRPARPHNRPRPASPTTPGPNVPIPPAGAPDGAPATRLPGAPERFWGGGGRTPATSTCEILDLSSTNAWVFTGSMQRARRNHNTVLLADG